MKKRILAGLALAAMAALLLCGCTRSTYTQEDIGEPPATIDETTILGTWYFEGHESATIQFHEDGTYETDNEGKKGNGTYTLSDDCKTLHLKEETSSVDEDVSFISDLEEQQRTNLYAQYRSECTGQFQVTNKSHTRTSICAGYGILCVLRVFF